MANAKAEQEVLHQEAENKQARLDADVRRVADAERYRREQEAEAAKFEKVEAAKADRAIAEQEAESIRLRAEAEAEATRLTGEAKADSIRAEAEALEQNRDALLAQKALDILPELMKNFADGYSSIKGLTIIGGGEDGASSHMAGESSRALASTMETVKSATGIDIGGILQSSVNGRAFGQGLNESTDEKRIVIDTDGDDN